MGTEDTAHRIFRESSSEPRESRMIRRNIIKRQPQELLEGIPVVDLGFQFQIGVDFKPLLKKQAFHQENRRVGAVSLKAFTDGIVSQKQASILDQSTTRLISSILWMALFFSMVLKMEMSVKVRLVFIFLKPMVPPEGLICRNHGLKKQKC
ncbi:MAG: hypothetical protein PHT62_13280 [Desulfotomaculaceae bacterium]|nr:hypothetical protein [Desulfotomaculaceae bacterium]